MTVASPDGQEYALFLEATDRIPPAIPNLLRLLLNYRYGLDILAQTSVQDALPLSSKYGASLRVMFMFQELPVDNRSQLLALGRRGQVPLFLLVPQPQVQPHKSLCKGLRNIFVCGWEDTSGGSGPSLQQIVTAVCDQQGIGVVQISTGGATHDQLVAVVEQRLKHVRSLPTLPDLVSRVTKLLSDPATEIADLEQALVTDPAMVHRLVRVVSSPAFAGLRASGEWTLRQAVVRLGLQQVGAIAQQIKLMNSLIRPHKCPFDIRRFWEHSVGVAVIADTLHNENLLHMDVDVPIDQYWIGGLLHDIGKLVMGFFFWDAFDAVIQRMTTPKTPFHWAEARLGTPITHEHISQLVLSRAKADPAAVEAVGSHNTVGRRPTPLVCLLHVADNFAKAAGLGYLEKEAPVYSPPVLDALGITEENILEIQRTSAEEMAAEVASVVGLCLGK
jgi:HD-like signal output (HDOD) protein